MSAPTAIELAPGYRICPLINGCWQLSTGHSREPWTRTEALRHLHSLVDAGRTTFDCADIYTGVEDVLGELRAEVVARTGDPEALQIHTKCVPDLARLPALRRRDVVALIDRSLRRLGTDRLDLVQFYWWDLSVPGWLDAVSWLDELRRQGKIRLLGLTNYDAERVEEARRAGLSVDALQIQYSLLDRRPATDFGDEAPAPPLLCYGALAGGFLTERWLDRSPPGPEPANRSLVKYRLIIDECGGWVPLQRLLTALADVARRRQSSLATIAAAWVLEQPSVAAVILGVGRGRAPLELPTGGLNEEDRQQIAGALPASPPGSVYALERDREGPHGRIMRYDLNG